MKKCISLITCLIGFWQYTHAQTEKRTIAVGMQAAQGIWRADRSNTSSLRLTPSVGFFLKKNVLIGVGIPLDFGKTSFARASLPGDLSRLTSSSIGLALIARRYFSEGRLKPFIHLDGGYTWNTVQLYRLPQDAPSGTATGQTIRANTGLGVSYFTSNRFSVEATASLGIANVKGAFENKALDAENRFLLIGIGANWYLPTRAD